MVFLIKSIAVVFALVSLLKYICSKDYLLTYKIIYLDRICDCKKIYLAKLLAAIRRNQSWNFASIYLYREKIET